MAIVAGKVKAISKLIGNGQQPVAHVILAQCGASGIIEDQQRTGTVQSVDEFLVSGQEAVGALVEPGGPPGASLHAIEALAVGGDEDVAVGHLRLHEDWRAGQKTPGEAMAVDVECV